MRIRRCGQGLRLCNASAGARVIATGIDPICALQSCMEGFDVADIESFVGEVEAAWMELVRWREW